MNTITLLDSKINKMNSKYDPISWTFDINDYEECFRKINKWLISKRWWGGMLWFTTSSRW